VSAVPSYYWHDYETTGADTRRDRPLQFAGQRTNEAFEPIGEPTVAYCRPPRDRLPHPDACLITGITPQLAEREGLVEAEFTRVVHEQLAEPGTCGVGYNSIRFDDEFTRNLLYRNFHEPYAREWQRGNSRWDLIDALRMAYALRPSGVEWPRRDDGSPSFRLEDLAEANHVREGAAHDALSDVRATIGMARRLRAAQPQLVGYLLALRDKRKALALLDWQQVTPLLHSSSRIPAARGATTLVAPLAAHPAQSNAVIVFDLMQDPEPLLQLDYEQIAERLYTPRRDLPEGEQRVALKLVRANHAPALAPMSVLRGVDLARIGLDPDLCLARAEVLRAHAPLLRAKLHLVYADRPPGEPEDADLAMISGGLPPDREAGLRERVRRAAPAELVAYTDRFSEPRYRELLFRYRARNWPETLSPDERERWREHCRARIERSHVGGGLGIDDYRARIAELRATHGEPGRAWAILDALTDWGDTLASEPDHG